MAGTAASRDDSRAIQSRVVHVPIGDTWIDAMHATYSGYAFAPHVHEEYAIGATESGTHRLRHGRNVVIVPAGAVVTISAGVVHTGEAIGASSWTQGMLYLPAGLMRTVALGVGRKAGKPFFPRPFVREPGLSRRIASLVQRLVRGDPPISANDELATILEQLIVRHSVSEDNAPGTPPTIIDAVREQLEARFREHVRLKELAECAGLSVFGLVRQFRQAMGMPPYAYLTQVRVANARTMLRAGHGVGEVAYACGFSDQSHLTRTFKRLLGFAPGSYARSIRGTREDGGVA